MTNDPKTGRFQKGQHWRPKAPYWDREWLRVEYEDRKRSAPEIAAQFGIGATAILFWLKKHGIATRTMSEVRSIKHWGLSGETNGMFGVRREKHPNWKGGITPARQKIYGASEWRSVVRKLQSRDRICRMCGSGGPLEIHHIMTFADAPLLALDIGNLIRLCKSCHNKIRNKENRWKKRLFNLLKSERR